MAYFFSLIMSEFLWHVKNPDKGQQTTSVSYIEVGDKIEVPESYNFSANTNSAGIEKALTQRIGIFENLNMPPDGQSRLPLAANIRHALYYCFQGQDEIAAKISCFIANPMSS